MKFEVVAWISEPVTVTGYIIALRQEKVKYLNLKKSGRML
jgi:hypothetical protein